MAQDFGWQRAAASYSALYRSLHSATSGSGSGRARRWESCVVGAARRLLSAGPMKRNTLSDFLRGLVIAALPVAAVAGCCSDYDTEFSEQVDAFAAVTSDGGVLPGEVCNAVCKSPGRGSVKQVYGCRIGDTNDGGAITAVVCDGKSSTVATSSAPAGGRRSGCVRGARRTRDPRAHSSPRWPTSKLLPSTASSSWRPPSRFTARRFAGGGCARAHDEERRHARVAVAFARRYGAASCRRS